MPSAFPPPCATRRQCHRWPAGLRENSVLCLKFCRQEALENKTECWPFFSFFPALFGTYCVQESLKSDKKSRPKSIKMETWGGPGGSWGSSWRHLGPKSAQSSKNLKKVTSRTPSPGAKLGAKIEKSHPELFFDVFVWVCFGVRFCIDFM